MIQFLSSQRGFYFFLFLALLLRVVCEINNPVITSDNAIQMEAAKNFIHSGIFSRAWVDASDLSHVHSMPMKLWPVGFPFILVLINYLTGNLIYSAVIFQCLGVILFIMGIVRLLKYLNVPLLYINLFLLLYAFNAAPFYYLGSTDLFTVSLFLFIIYYSLKVINDTGYSIGNIFILSLLTFLTAAVRLACIPNMVIVPFFFLIIAFFTRQKLAFIKAVLVMSMSGLLVFLFYSAYPFDSARTGFLKVLLSGDLYYSHIKWFDPFPIKSLFFTRPIEFRLPNKPALITAYRVSLLFISYGFLIYILIRFAKTRKLIAYVRSVKTSAHDRYLQYFLLFISACAVIIGFITLQSLTTNPEANSFGPAWMPHFWTFVYNTRYFIYLMAMIIVIYFVAYYQSENQPGHRRFFNISYGIFISWAIFYWLYITYQFYSPNGNGAGSEWRNEKTSITAYNEIKKIKSIDKGAHIVFAHYHDKMIEGLVTNFSDAYPTDDYQAIIGNRFKNSAPAFLVMTMPAELNETERRFLNGHKHNVLASLTNEQIIRIDL